MEGHLEHDGHRTWYRVVGELDAAPRAPVIICHGGPGATHDYVAPIAEQLNRSGRACVLYDQLGNGRSDHLPDADPSFWTVERFERELAALAAHLGIDGRYHVVGQSWGGMLALLHALERPPGLVSVVAADAPSSIPGFVAGCNELLDAMEADPTVYGTMNGPTEFTVVGTIRDFDITDRLAEIDVPVLLVSGAHDEVRPAVVAAMDERLRHGSWVLFEDSSHMPHIEEPERFLAVVEEFLERTEA